MKNPLLFLVFNRPDTTKRVFAAIRQAQPPRLYIAADGPRPDKPGELEKCEQVRKIAMAVDWDCEVKTLFREKNLGCKYAVSGAINWFFENEDQGIILEDDCLPHQDFFRFCDEMLDKYRDNDLIFSINGNHNIIVDYKYSYYFTIFTNVWGWATWKNRWRLYDIEMNGWIEFKNNKKLRFIYDDKSFINHWERIFEATYNGNINTWDFQLLFCSFSKNKLSVQPVENLVSNIGFGKTATITKNIYSERANQKTFGYNYIIHPESINRSYYQEIESVNKMNDKYNKLYGIIKKIFLAYKYQEIYIIIRKIYTIILRFRIIPKRINANIGCGKNPIINEHWVNFDIVPSSNVYYIDVSKPIPLSDKQFSLIFTEHMIEHISKIEAKRFLKECFRLLIKGGVIRIATTDLNKILKLSDTNNNDSIKYIYELSNLLGTKLFAGEAINSIFYGHGHKYIYSFETIKSLLIEVGFVNIKKCKMYISEHIALNNLEKHHLTVGKFISEFETLVVEAEKNE